MSMGRCRVHVDGEVDDSRRWGGGGGFMSMGRCRVHVDGGSVYLKIFLPNG